MIKSDLTGKSNHGSQQHESPVAKITNEPKGNYEASFLTPDGAAQTVHIEIIGSDKTKEDKSVGELSLDLDNVDAMDGQEGRWSSLAGTKSGQFLLRSDFIEKIGNNRPTFNLGKQK